MKQLNMDNLRAAWAKGLKAGEVLIEQAERLAALKPEDRPFGVRGCTSAESIMLKYAYEHRDMVVAVEERVLHMGPMQLLAAMETCGRLAKLSHTVGDALKEEYAGQVAKSIIGEFGEAVTMEADCAADQEAERAAEAALENRYHADEDPREEALTALFEEQLRDR